MDALVLVLVFDLAAAIRYIDVHSLEHMTLGLGERVAQAPEGDRQIARRIGRRIEMLVEHLIGWSEYDTVLPVDPHEILGDVVPEQRVAVAGDGEHMEIRTVPV